uniref:Translational initiation factor 1 n=1 Tax=Spirodela intermedia TaxID=51605 RepID=A0A8S0XJH2_SPIIN
MFWLHLDNENLILAYLLGRIRHGFIQILPVDKVKIEISTYDSTCDV